MKKALLISDLHIGFEITGGQQSHVAGPINVSVETGQLICLIGPNGVGKSTLLRTIAGIQPPLGGNIHILDQPLKKVNKKELARLLSVVLTDRISYGNFTAFEIVALGRTPYTGWMGTLTREDHDKVLWAMESTHISHLAHKSIHELSDGEKQKVMIARALAQDTPVVLLDEPTAHLDLPSRIEIIRLLRNLARRTGKVILLSTHELDLVLQAADGIWLMSNENKTYSGTPEDLVLDNVIEKVFTGEGMQFDKRHGVFKLVEPHSNGVYVAGDQPALFWTKRALERNGFSIHSAKGKGPSIEVLSLEDGWKWNCMVAENQYTIHSVGELLNVLAKHPAGL